MSDNVPTSLDDIEFGATMRGHQSGDLAFKRFALKKVLGRGGMGVVWLGADTLLGREVALKFAPDTLRSDDAAIEELKGETVRGQDLSHPNIVKIYDFFLDDSHAAICMEFVDGDTLARLRVRQPNKVFEPRQVARWVAQMLEGLSYAHRSGKIVHRDLKPPNLIINSQGDLKIMDFGIARSIQDSMARVTIAGNSTGTLAYMSPQQAAGRSASISDDIYSFGSTLYELFTGKPPFHSGDFGRQIREDIPPTITQRRHEFGLTGTEPFPPEWEELISRCLSKQPETRPASMDEIRAYLGMGGSALPPSLAPSSLEEILHTHQNTLIADTGLSATALSAAGRAVTVRSGGALSPLMDHTAAATQRPTMPTAFTSAVTMAAPPTANTGAPPLPPRKSIPVWLIAACGALVVGGAAAFMLWPKPSPDSASVENPPTPPVIVGNTTSQENSAGSSRTTPTPQPPTRPPDPPPSNGPAPLVVPDGYPTIQAAIAAAKPGDTVRLKANTYEENIKLADGVSLAAAETGARVLITADGASGSTLDLEKVKTPVKITGITFAHNDGNAASTAGAPVVSVLSSNVTFENCVFELGLGDGVKVEGTGKVAFLVCSARQNQGSGFKVTRGANIIMEKCQATSNGQDGLTVEGRAGVEANGSDFTRNQNGIAVQKGAALKASQVYARENSLNGLYVVEAGCQVEWKGGGLSRNGYVFTGNASKGTLSGQGGGGLVAEIGPLIVLEDVQVEGNAKSGIQLVECTSGSAIRRCTIKDNPQRGIILEGVAGQDITLEGNQCLGGGQHGIIVQGPGFSPKLIRNHCASNALTGIFIVAGAKPVLDGNTFQGNSKDIDGAQ